MRELVCTTSHVFGCVKLWFLRAAWEDEEGVTRPLCHVVHYIDVIYSSQRDLTRTSEPLHDPPAGKLETPPTCTSSAYRDLEMKKGWERTVFTWRQRGFSECWRQTGHRSRHRFWLSRAYRCKDLIWISAVPSPLQKCCVLNTCHTPLCQHKAAQLIIFTFVLILRAFKIFNYC